MCQSGSSENSLEPGHSIYKSGRVSYRIFARGKHNGRGSGGLAGGYIHYQTTFVVIFRYLDTQFINEL